MNDNKITVGIMTYHHHYNYGTMLQAYALQKAAENCNCNAEIINFIPHRNESLSDKILLRIRRLPIYIVEFKKRTVLLKARNKIAEKKRLFEAFYTEKINLGKGYYSNSEQLNQNPPKYEGYIVGSDQTWNPYVANRPEAFYLSFVKDDKLKGSYAPSVAVDNLNAEQADYIRQKLSGFKFLSCREKTGALLLEKVLKTNVEAVLDPTLLLTGDEWRSECRESIDSEGYLLTYFLEDNKKNRVIAREIAKKMGLKIKAIPVSYLDFEAKDADIVDAGPREFLELIDKASMICTDSFHGTAFSINLNKNFYSLRKNSDGKMRKENSRISDILKELGIADRLIADTPETVSYIDYEKVNQILDEKRQKSMSYLREMVEEWRKYSDSV